MSPMKVRVRVRVGVGVRVRVRVRAMQRSAAPWKATCTVRARIGDRVRVRARARVGVGVRVRVRARARVGFSAGRLVAAATRECFALVEAHGEASAAPRPYRGDSTDVAVEDEALIVVSQLDHLVRGRVRVIDSHWLVGSSAQRGGM